MEAITLGGLLAVLWAARHMYLERKQKRSKQVKTLDSAQIAQVIAKRARREACKG